ncbi:MAG: TPM domain-containing protein [Desulfuromonas sp.]|nr:TPM domain-containing protein [Desulfuromonas sp.]
MRILCSLALLLLVGVVPCRALDIPAPQGYVTDVANLIDDGTELKLEQFLNRFEQTDSTQLVILTLPNLDGEPADQAALTVAEQWKIGQSNHDNGLLLLVSKQDRRVRIEVGKGLEGRLTDLLAGRIIDQELVPQFKQGNYTAGIVAAVVGMTDAVRGEYQGTGTTKRKKKKNPMGWLMTLLFIAPALLGGRRRRSIFWMGGGFGGGGFGGGGGGGFSGGGGSFGGGGASGSW